MKRPNISLDKEAVVDFLLRHGEKFVVGVIAMAALGLAWGGVDAIQSKSATEQQSPRTIERSADEAASHVEREKSAPATEKRSGPPLSAAIDPWRDPTVTEPPALALLDRPLFEEFAKRTQPDVFPIEDLRAVAGLAVLPAKQAAAPAAADPLPARPKPRKRGEPEPGAGEQPFDLGGGGPAAVDQARGRILPYVVVTGLIPVAKQVAEYGRRFESVGFKDPKRDTPLWADWSIERTTVGGGGDRWERLDIAEAGRRWQADGAGGAPEPVPDAFLLPAALDKRNPKTTPPYCGVLPQLLKGSWTVVGVHPWVVDQVRKLKDPRPAAAAPEPVNADPANVFAGEGEPPRPETTVVGGQAESLVEYGMFRFIDTAVAPGKAYRYRVRFELWNPNYKIPSQHLTQAALAQEMKLPSTPSNETQPVSVPDSTSTLVAMLRKADMKKLKPGWFELLVLAPSAKTGDYALRGLVTEAGGLVNVDEKLNKPGDRRTRGEEIRTERVVVDARGRQEDRADVKSKRPPEPFELLCLRPDGGFEFVSAADSEAVIAEHAATLPAGETAKSDGKPGQPEPGSPF
ncbi:MAG: hypothetical protein ACKOC4_05300 [Planctomycetia bacterium]